MQNKQDIRILAIETSCDETAAAVIGVENDQPIILSNIVSSQVDLHSKTGGVVPEVASRAHVESIIPVISEALLQTRNSKLETRMFETNSNDKNSKKFKTFENSDFDIVSDFDIRISNLYPEAIKYLQDKITHIAVTNGPGLIGSLLVGYNAAKTIAYALDKPIIPINHIEGHIYSALSGEIRNPKSEILNKSENSNDKNLKHVSSFDISALSFPLIALTVSGGHTSLTLMRDHGVYENIGSTLDDAAGEAFDKVAKLLGLGYPGGPIVSKLASEHRNKLQVTSYKDSRNSKLVTSNSKIVFPRPIMNDGTFNFSFSGLKTAVLQKVIDIKKDVYYSRHPELVSGSHGERMLKPVRQAQGVSEIELQVQHDINQTEIPDDIKQEICAAFEDAVVDVLVTKTIRAAKKFEPKTIILAGGVAANKHLREVLQLQVTSYPTSPRLRGAGKSQEKNSKLGTSNSELNLLVPPINLCGDNAAMIGLAAYYHVLKNNVLSWDKMKVDSNLEL